MTKKATKKGKEPMRNAKKTKNLRKAVKPVAKDTKKPVKAKLTKSEDRKGKVPATVMWYPVVQHSPVRSLAQHSVS